MDRVAAKDALLAHARQLGALDPRNAPFMTMTWPPKPSADELSSPSIRTLRQSRATSARSSTVRPSTAWRAPKCS
ncbi:MAG TPA: hypothetical protein VG455_12925 [Acidimicrobiales bacterium]|nr:hypothetical protein [Acidimicrobiales bacterium]